ncbi:hypothetical protein Tco_0841135 [Tanacetum coccineum]|uniref:Uncharacterized protein n=1 Tax=Tanacetum coccineum TaxID=301880 RepID=A0ABQ5AZ14_9ASTR
MRIQGSPEDREPDEGAKGRSSRHRPMHQLRVEPRVALVVERFVTAQTEILGYIAVIGTSQRAEVSRAFQGELQSESVESAAAHCALYSIGRRRALCRADSNWMQFFRLRGWWADKQLECLIGRWNAGARKGGAAQAEDPRGVVVRSGAEDPSWGGPRCSYSEIYGGAGIEIHDAERYSGTCMLGAWGGLARRGGEVRDPGRRAREWKNTVPFEAGRRATRWEVTLWGNSNMMVGSVYTRECKVDTSRTSLPVDGMTYVVEWGGEMGRHVWWGRKGGLQQDRNVAEAENRLRSVCACMTWTVHDSLADVQQCVWLGDEKTSVELLCVGMFARSNGGYEAGVDSDRIICVYASDYGGRRRGAGNWMRG